MTPEDIARILDQNFAPWVKDLRLEVVEVTPDASTFRMPLGPHLARVGGIVSGQALAALADTAMVLAAMAQAGQFRPFATTNLDTQFLRPGVGSAILAQAVIVRAGKALIFARCDMTEEDSSKPVATANATLYAP